VYKVLIIDDEPIIRKGLKNIISWNQYGCEVCGEAGDGVEGVEMIKEHSPDIIFTDICMPEMDGLEMIKHMVSVDNHAKIVILTGYCDFAYVKEALVLGAFDYILKPTKLKEIKEVTLRAVKQLDDEKKAKEISLEMREKYQKSLPKLREKLLFEVMMGITTDEHEINQRKNNLGIDIKDFVMILAGSRQKSNTNDDIKYGAVQTFEDMLGEDYPTLSIAIDDCNAALIVMVENEYDEEGIKQRCKELQVMMRDSINMDVSLYISDKGSGIQDIFSSYGQCRSTADKKANNAFELLNGKSMPAEKRAALKISGLGQLLLDTIPFGSMTMTTDSYENLHNEAVKMENYKEIVYEKIKKIAETLSRAAEQADYSVSSEASLDGLFADVKRFAEIATKSAKENSKENMRLVTKKAIEYLQSNYQRQVTLNEVANAVYVSPFYISRIFKKETGRTMTEYLNDLRIDNACILLEDIRYKVYQVGEMVGISDAHYFSRMFKNNLGVTPSEYRNNLEAK